MLPQLRELAARFRAHDLLVGLTIFSIGLFKKVVFADSFSLYATPVFDAAAKGQAINFSMAWLGVLAYTFQIYFDFSGYSDMAIGLGRMLGINLPINFNAPYRSTSITDFWRRWHITLGRFLRDYLYFPMGGSHVAPPRQFSNLMVVMLLCGLWHGAAWTFVVWGALHGLALAADRLWARFHHSYQPSGLLWRSSGWAFTSFFVVLTWVFFRADSVGTALDMLTSMFGLSSAAKVPIDALSGTEGGWSQAKIAWIAIVLAAIWVLVAPTMQDLMRRELRSSMYEPYVNWAAAPLWAEWRPTTFWVVGSAVVFSAAFLGLSRVTEFIYYNF